MRELSQDFPGNPPSSQGGILLPPMIKTPKEVTRPSERNGSGAY